MRILDSGWNEAADAPPWEGGEGGLEGAGRPIADD